MNYIGMVTEVSHNSMKFEVSDFNKLVYNYNGYTYRTEGVIDYVTIIDDFSRKYIYQVIKVEVDEKILGTHDNAKIESTGIFQCIPVGTINDGKVQFNLSSYPFLRNRVYLASNEDLKILFSITNNGKNIYLGNIKESYPAEIELEKLLNHHTAILGNTGSGKSTTIRQIISQLDNIDSKNLYIHLFDIHNEFATAKENRKNILEEFKIEICTLGLQDWINLIRPSELVQLPILQTALKLSHAIATHGGDLVIWLKCYLAHTLYNYVQTDVVGKRTKILNILEGTKINTNNYSSQFGNFSPIHEEQFLIDLTTTMNKIESEMTNEEYLSHVLNTSDYKANSFDNLFQGLEYAFLLEESKGNSQVRSYCVTLETRIKSIATRYSVFLTEKRVSQNTFSKINIYEVDDMDDDLLLFFSSYFIKELFEKNKSVSIEDRDIHVVILEEAHRYISKNKEESSFNEVELFKKVAREGRKFGCFLFLSSQRPSELSSTVLSQCNNYILHRIKNNLDLEYMMTTIPYIDKYQLSRISNLPTGYAYLVGDLFPIPIEVDVHEVVIENNQSSTPEIKYN